MLSVVTLNVIILRVVMLNVIMLSVVMLNVIMLSVALLNVVAPSLSSDHLLHNLPNKSCKNTVWQNMVVMPA
jgi:hypothetical protein